MEIEHDDVQDRRPSVKLVYHSVRMHEPITQSEIVDRQHLDPETVRRALDELIDSGVLERERDIVNDARRVLYSTVD